MLIIDTKMPIAKVVTTLKKYTRASVKPVMSSNQGRVWIYVSNIPFGRLSWEDVCQKEGFAIVPE